MTDPIPPALTPEEWSTKARMWPADGDEGDAIPLGFQIDDEQGGAVVIPIDYEGCYRQAFFDGNDRHGLAALCLYGQSFGFTRADVDALLYTLDDASKCGTDDELRSIAARIAALLPPEPPQ